MEAMYKLELQCVPEMLGNLFSVIARRRGRILSDKVKEGTSLFIINALLPVAESFGFATGTSPDLFACCVAAFAVSVSVR
jgi:ribosome assembly protein 1